jgi:hypothetical protein
MKNKVTLFVGDEELDMFGDEDIVINLSVQNIQDISKVFTDFTQGFSVPATPRNNAIFSHYYRTDIVGGADYRLRAEGYIEINGLLFRYGSIELEGVQMRQNAPYAYDVTFYGLLVNLTDLFGEDYLYDLESLSAFNHTYDQATVHSGLTSTALDPVYYPFISAQDVWIYDSDNNNHQEENIAFHNINETHGVQYYDLKPAIPIQEIITAIETKYGVTFNISGISDFEYLYMWCHRTAGYMYERVNYTMPWTLATFATTTTPLVFDTGTNIWTVDKTTEYAVSLLTYDASQDYEIGVFVNGVLFQAYSITAHPLAFQARAFSVDLVKGDELSVYVRSKQFNSLDIEVTRFDAFEDATQKMRADNTAIQSIPAFVDIPSLMPEQRIVDFLSSICKMFNLVIIPISSTEFDLKPLQDWYGTGSDVDVSQYFDITESQVERPQLYKQIQFQYNETGAITGEQYRLTNNLGYGDLRSEFVFDTDEELMVQPQFDQMLFSRFTDIDDSVLTPVLAGFAITRELESYLGQPFIFYINGFVDISAKPVSFIDKSNTITGHTSVELTDIVYANSSSQQTTGAITYSTNYGADLDPYLLESITNSLYYVYWQDYVTDLYDPSRRLVRIPAILPLGKILNFDLANKLIWNGEKWIVNNVQINLTTGKAEFELLNDV